MLLRVVGDARDELHTIYSTTLVGVYKAREPLVLHITPLCTLVEVDPAKCASHMCSCCKYKSRTNAAKIAAITLIDYRRQALLICPHYFSGIWSRKQCSLKKGISRYTFSSSTGSYLERRCTEGKKTVDSCVDCVLVTSAECWTLLCEFRTRLLSLNSRLAYVLFPVLSACSVNSTRICAYAHRVVSLLWRTHVIPCVVCCCWISFFPTVLRCVRVVTCASLSLLLMAFHAVSSVHARTTRHLRRVYVNIMQLPQWYTCKRPPEPSYTQLFLPFAPPPPLALFFLIFNLSSIPVVLLATCEKSL